MPLVDVREQFIKFSGRYDLVVDQVEWADNGADFFIRAGNRWLDRFGDIAKTVARYFEPLEAGRWYALAPTRAVREVWVHTDDGVKYRLCKLAFDAFRKKYPHDPAQMTHGRPRHYAILPLRVVPEIQSTTVVDVYDGVRYTNEYFIEYFLLRSALTQDVFTVYIDAAHQLTIVPDMPTTRIENTVIAPLFDGAILDCISIPAQNNPSITMYITADMSGQLVAEQIAPLIPITPAPQPFTAQSLAETRDEIRVHSSGQFSVLVGPAILTPPDYAFTGIIFLPPTSDNIVHLEVVSTAHQYELTLDTDENFWTEREPFILVMAACRALEISYRNNAGVTDWTEAIKAEILGLEFDFAEELSNEIRQMDG